MRYVVLGAAMSVALGSGVQAEVLGKTTIKSSKAAVGSCTQSCEEPTGQEGGAPPPPTWNHTYSHQVDFYSWTGSKITPGSTALTPGWGNQLYTSFGIQSTATGVENYKFEISARGGYVWSRQATVDLAGEVETFVDTTVSGTATYLGFNGVQPFLSLNANVPTGQSVLRGRAVNARMDGDLVGVGSFGSGWTLGPTVGVNVPITPEIMLAVSGGATFRGKYEQEGPIDATTSQQGTRMQRPSDAWTLNSSLGYSSGPVFLQVSGSWTTETDSYVDNTPSYRAGNQWSVMTNASYSWTPTISTAVVGSWSYSEVNFSYDATLFQLVQDQKNTNSSSYRIRIDQTVNLGDWTVAPYVNWLLRDQNAWDRLAFQFLPARTKWGLGTAVKYKLTEKVALNSTLERIWVDDFENPAKIVNDNPIAAIPALHYDAWAATIALSWSF